MHVNLVSNR